MTPYDAGYRAYLVGVSRVLDVTSYVTDGDEWKRGWNAARDFYLAGKSWWNNMTPDERDAALRAAGTDRVDEAYRWWLESRKESVPTDG